MGNCCTDNQHTSGDIQTMKTTFKFGSSDKVIEERCSNLDNSETFSEFSEVVNPKDLEVHCPDNDYAVKIKEIPEDLKIVIDDRMMDVSTFEFDQDDEIVNEAILIGPRQLPSHAIYIGQWLNKMRNGRGQQVSADGSIYEGYWKDNKRWGKGRLIDKSGDVYRGNWKEDLCHGYGELTKANGAVYRGFFKNDKRSGDGVEIWPTGERYEGKYENGQKHGKGTYWTADESYYKGDFKFNSIDGEGEFCWSDGNKYKGAWRNNEKNGHGIYYWGNGSRYVGGYMNDEKHGNGKYSNKKGDCVEGKWNMGRVEGDVRVVIDGKIYEGKIENRAFSLNPNSNYQNKSKIVEQVNMLITDVNYEN